MLEKNLQISVKSTKQCDMCSRSFYYYSENVKENIKNAWTKILPKTEKQTQNFNLLIMHRFSSRSFSLSTTSSYMCK